MKPRIVKPRNQLSPAERGALVEAHRGLARGVAAWYVGRGLSFRELEAAALYGLFRAACLWDPARRVPFRAYARRWVMQTIRQDLSNTHRLGIRMMPAGVRRQYRTKRTPDDLDQPHELATARTPPPAHQAAAREHATWAACMRLLPPLERATAELRWKHDLTTEEAAALLGVSHQRVAQIEAAVVQRLRRAVVQRRVPGVEAAP